MKRTLAPIAALLALACFASTPLHADGYVGFSYGESSADMQGDALGSGGSPTKVDETDNAWKAFGGWHAKWVGVEAAWQDLGSFSLEDGQDFRTLDARGLSAEVLGRIPLGKVFAFFGKVGALWWTAESVTFVNNIRLRIDDTGFDLMYGAGIDLIIKKISIRLEYERFDKVSAADTAIDFASLGIMFNF